MSSLDIVIPVYNEGRNILAVLDAFRRQVRTPHRVLICYDSEDDDTLPAVRHAPGQADIVLVQNPNPGQGPHSAVRAGLAASTAPAVLVYMADDDYNADIIDIMYRRFSEGCDVVAASRFVEGGCMIGCDRVKEAVARFGSMLLNKVAGLPVHDGTNAFRLFSRRLLDAVEIESREGFTFSVELLAKSVRLGWPVTEVPARWYERADKPSRFRTVKWLPAYIHWLLYAMATRWLGLRMSPRAKLQPGPRQSGNDLVSK